METYTVLLSQETTVPPSLATELGRIVDRPVGEVTRGIREHPWILIEGVEAVHLDPIFDLLNGAGVTAKALPDVHMPKLPRALRVREADPLSKSFFLQVAESPAPPAMPWEDLRIVTAGRVTLGAEEAGRIYGEWRGPNLGGSGTTTPGSVGMASRPESREPFLADLVVRGDSPMRLRIEAGHFKYDYLRDRMKPASPENFRQLLLDIRRRAPQARFTRPAEALLEGGAARDYRFRSLAAFTAYTRWVLQAEEESEAAEADAE